MRTSKRLARISGVSTAGLRMSPASPPVQQTSTLCTPSAAYLAVVPAPFDASSSGCACTWSKQRRLDRGTNRKLVETGRRRMNREHRHRADAAQVEAADGGPRERRVTGQL